MAPRHSAIARVTRAGTISVAPWIPFNVVTSAGDNSSSTSSALKTTHAIFDPFLCAQKKGGWKLHLPPAARVTRDQGVTYGLGLIVFFVTVNVTLVALAEQSALIAFSSLKYLQSPTTVAGKFVQATTAVVPFSARTSANRDDD